MEQQTATVENPGFVDRRDSSTGAGSAGFERRQFRDGKRSSRPEVTEVAEAVDEYKVSHRRRFITFEELFDVMSELGYHK